MLTISPQTLDNVLSHAERAFPEECCGILIGTTEDDSRHAAFVIPCRNAHPAPGSHYRIAPTDLASAQRLARDSGRQIVGFYHSHPNHPAQASQSDQADAEWPGCSYLIVSVTLSGAGEVDSFLCEREQILIPENLKVIE